MKNEERELSPPLEQLIDQMANTVEADGSKDEGYEAADEGPEDEDGEKRSISAIRSYQDVMKVKRRLTECLPLWGAGDAAFDGSSQTLYSLAVAFAGSQLLPTHWLC